MNTLKRNNNIEYVGQNQRV